MSLEEKDLDKSKLENSSNSEKKDEKSVKPNNSEAVEVIANNEEESKYTRNEEITYRAREYWLSYESPANSKTTVIILAIAFLAFLAIFIILFSSEKKEQYVKIEEFKKLEAQLYQLEERLVWQDEKIDSLQFNNERKRLAIKEATKEDENEKIEESIKPIEEKPLEPDLEGEEEPEPQETVNQDKVQEKVTASYSKGTVYKYHRVNPGETLYRISLKYNLTIDDLRRLNNLGENDSIRTGQRLIVEQYER